MYENIHVLIVDDDDKGIFFSKHAISEYVKEENIVLVNDAQSALKVMKEQQVDIVFLDIEMPGIDGFSLAEFLSKNYPQSEYVFLTGHIEFGAQSYDYTPLDFLTKPVNIIRLNKTFEKYNQKHNKAKEETKKIAISTNSGYVLISPKDIQYIAKEARKTVIHCKSNSYIVQSTLEELETIFKDHGLFRCHQSALVPLSRIASFQMASFGKTYQAILDDGTIVPVSRGKYNSLKTYLIEQGVRFI